MCGAAGCAERGRFARGLFRATVVGGEDGPKDILEALREVTGADAVLGDPGDLFGVRETPLDEAGGVFEHALTPVLEGFIAVVGSDHVGSSGLGSGGFADYSRGSLRSEFDLRAGPGPVSCPHSGLFFRE